MRSRTPIIGWFLTLALSFAVVPPGGAAPHGAPVVLYDFADAKGDIVRDRSGVGKPLDLKIKHAKAVRRSAGALEIRGKTIIKSETPPAKLVEAVMNSGAITLEAWIKPANSKQTGPARIVTISKNSSERNITLGQDGDKIDARLRTGKLGSNGLPSLASSKRSLAKGLHHVVYTRHDSGRARLFVNGKRCAERDVPGDLSNWDLGHRLALGNELSGDRPWLGTLYRVAIYARAFEGAEVMVSYRAGKDAAAGVGPGGEEARSAELFVNEIEPLLAKHCLECHDAGSAEGELDLSSKTAALAGGAEGTVLVPGKATKSYLWELVESDEMPEKRDPLTPEEKKKLRDWIDSGAVFASERVDPSAHKLAREASSYTRRLTNSEYIGTIRAAVGVDIEKEARELLPPELRADGFSNTAYNMGVDLKHIEAYSRLAEIVVGKMDIPSFAARFSKNRSLTQKPFRPHVEKMGKWLLRGPLQKKEIDLFHGVSTSVAAAGGDFDDAVRHVVLAMLQSPRFLYRAERSGGATGRPASDYELASRLSYMIWGGPPDEELLRAAGEGELGGEARLSSQVRRMLKDARAIRRSKEFVSEWLDLARLTNMQPNKTKFPTWSATLASDMREETLAFFEEVVWGQGRPMADLLNAQLTVASPDLARHYGIDPTGGQKTVGGGMRHDLSKVAARGGLLTQGSVLSIGGDDASMVTRGLFILHDLLRGAVKDPPPGTNTTPVASEPGLSQRGVAELRLADKSCGGCHQRFEPFAFAFERYDGVGAYQVRDSFGNALRQDGKVLLPGADAAVSYNTTAELMDLLAKSERVSENITWKIAQFALGRPLASSDRVALSRAHREAKKNGGTYAAVISALATSDLIRMIPPELHSEEAR